MSDQSLLLEIGQIAINAHDTARARDFYRDVLGVRHLFDAGPTLSFFQLGGVRLMIGPASSPELDHPASVLYLRVADIEIAHTRLGERGVAFVDRPHLVARMSDHELWMCFFHDSEGNLLALMSERY